jgi:pyridoxal phosphate enzyme (YggS family)
VKLARAGQTAFGENRAQELRDKMLAIDAELEWHFIGHLQRNKVNMVVGKVALIHSLDSERLAQAIDSRAKAQGIIQEVLIQVNVSREESKFGIREKDAGRLLEAALSLSGLRVRGLMTMAPFVDDEEGARPFFIRLRELRDEFEAAYSEAELELLSMGMTQDFEVAVEEGANLVRIGTAIFSA